MNPCQSSLSTSETESKSFPFKSTPYMLYSIPRKNKHSIDLMQHAHIFTCGQEIALIITLFKRGVDKMFDNCPGLDNIRTPTLKKKKCPECGTEVESFSTDMKVNCSKCGLTIYTDLQSCIDWCKYAEDCLGEELYQKLKQQRQSDNS